MISSNVQTMLSVLFVELSAVRPWAAVVLIRWCSGLRHHNSTSSPQPSQPSSFLMKIIPVGLSTDMMSRNQNSEPFKLGQHSSQLQSWNQNFLRTKTFHHWIVTIQNRVWNWIVKLFTTLSYTLEPPKIWAQLDIEPCQELPCPPSKKLDLWWTRFLFCPEII